MCLQSPRRCDILQSVDIKETYLKEGISNMSFTLGLVIITGIILIVVSAVRNSAESNA